MLNLIPSSEALQALQSGPCRVARQCWPWGKWVESDNVTQIEWKKGFSFILDKIKGIEGRPADFKEVFSIFLVENDKPTSQLWEPAFADHSASDWYVLQERV